MIIIIILLRRRRREPLTEIAATADTFSKSVLYYTYRVRAACVRSIHQLPRAIPRRRRLFLAATDDALRIITVAVTRAINQMLRERDRKNTNSSRDFNGSRGARVRGYFTPGGAKRPVIFDLKFLF